MINDDHYLRRCIACKHKQQFALPPINKKVILLDQFVFSNIAKSLDPKYEAKKRTADLTYYRDLFGQIDRLFKMQVLICPYTDMHNHESYVDDAYGTYKVIWKHLSSGTRLRHADSTFCTQVRRAFEKWLAPEAEHEGDTYCDDFRRKIDCWMDRLRIEFNPPLMHDLKDELIQNKGTREEGLSEVFARWKREKNLKFKDWFEHELHGVRKTLQNAFTKRLKLMMGVMQGEELQDYMSLIGDQKAQLVQDMFSSLKVSGMTPEDALKRIGEFLRSKDFENIPMIRIQSALWAGLAHQVCHGNMNPPTQSISNDFEFIAAYLPYVDAIFVDKQCYSLLTQNPVRDFIKSNTRIFSLHKRDEFKEYLQGIEDATSPAHKAKVEEVYGDTWLDPYYDIIKDQARLNILENR
jgi:hypothetical protein